jgi:hypothetical protein
VRTWPAILALLLLGALIPESIATTNTTPLKIVAAPITLPFLVAFYGTADLLVRELLRRRPLRWSAVLLLGAAFGFVNEGIIADTWYYVTPTGYTLINGVDYAWATALTIFHTVFSVVVPVLFVELLFPRLAAQPWLGRGGIIACIIVFALVSSLGVLAPQDRVYKLPVLLGVAALVALALVLPRARPRTLRPGPAPHLWWLRVAGFVGMTAFFTAIYALPPILKQTLGDPGGVAASAIAADIAGFFVCLGVVRRWSGSVGWGRPQTLALISGALLVSILLSVLLPDARAGLSPLLTIPFLALLIWQARHLAHSPSSTVAQA